jgi:hypothetical protein
MTCHVPHPLKENNMKKFLLFLATLVVSIAAFAQTVVTMDDGACNAYCTCSNVPNDANADIATWFPTNAGFTLSVDGKQFNGPSPVGILTAADGSYVSANVTFHRWTTRTTSGRVAGHTVQHCSLLGGSTLTEP